MLVLNNILINDFEAGSEMALPFFYPIRFYFYQLSLVNGSQSVKMYSGYVESYTDGFLDGFQITLVVFNGHRRT